MKEQIEDIAKTIKRHREFEQSSGATNCAVGRSMTSYNGGQQQFWLITKQATIVQFQKDLNGNVIPSSGYSESNTYKSDGFPIPRDSKLGGLLIQYHEGKHKYQTPSGEIEIEIFNRASYTPSLDDKELATDIIVRIAGDSRTHSFQNLGRILSLQIQIDEDRRRLELATEQESRELIKRIEIKEREKNEYLSKAQGFIRRYAELRYQPILDPIQDSIRRSKIFDGCLIITGGPGTGKTTSLIQRIKFLISPTIEEEVKLSQSQREILFNQKTSWVFYSPNELLALFLRNSMKMEELSADTERVKVWDTQKNELVKAYKLIDTNTKRPFLIYNRSNHKSLFRNNPEAISGILEDLQKFYALFQGEKMRKVLEIDASSFKWKTTGQSIQKFLSDRRDFENTDQFIRLFTNLNESYKSESDRISEQYSELIKNVAGRIQIHVTKDPSRVAILSNTLSNWRNSKDDFDGLDDDFEIEQEDFDEKEEQTSFDFEKEFFNKLKSLCRKQSLKRFDKDTRFTKRDRELLKLIPEVEDQSEYEEIGQAAFFKKYFERITKGITANVLREIPLMYKRFRRGLLGKKSPHCDLSLLEVLVMRDENSRIHSDEQSLLIYFINNICTILSKSFPGQYKSISHPYLNAFRGNCKPVIGIDEATDFSLIDLLAMISFRHPELSSVTLSGDEMQRMTSEGIKSWKDFASVMPGTERRDLEISYRQSPTLLSLAKLIHEQSTGTIARYQSYIEEDEMEPKPLMIISQDDIEKLNWIAIRILEIYKAYGETIPSIAVFLPEESQLESFARDLGSIDSLADVGIYVKACRNGEMLGDKNTVRVFSIDKIKGLEFEAVFFHNIDQLRRQNIPDDLLLKYLYVGLSRATFYIGLTLNDKFNDQLQFLNDSFYENAQTW